MSSWKRFGFGAVLFAGILLLLAYLAFFFLVRSDRFQQWLKREVFSQTGHTIDLSDIRLRFPLRFVASAFKISNEFGTVLEGERVIVTLSLLDLFLKSIHRIELQKPVFYIDRGKWFGSSEAASVTIGVRQLDIRDGTMVLKTTGAQSLDLRAVNVSAQNLNFRQAAAIVLQADIPSLQGSAEIAIRGGKSDLEAEIKLRQAPFGTFTQRLSSQTAGTDNLRVTTKLRRIETQAVEILTSGVMTGLTIGKAKITGQFDLRAQIEPSFKEAFISGHIQTKELPAQIGSVKLAVAGGADGTLSGSYVFPDRTLKLTSIRVNSAAGIAEGAGVISFNQAPTITNARATLREIPAAAVQPFLPEPVHAWSLLGTAEADLELEGPWDAMAVKGVARMHGAELNSATFSLRQFNLVARFEWFDSSLSGGPVQLQGKFLAAVRDAIQFAAELKLDGALESKPNHPLKTTARFRLTRGRYVTPDSSKMGENLVLGGRIEVMGREKRLLGLSGSLDVEEGEILWGKFFGDLKRHKASLDFDGDYRGDDDALQLRKLNLSLPTLGKVELKGTVYQIFRQPSLRTQIIASDVRAAGIFESFVRETLHRSYPILDQLMVGGLMDLTAQVHGTLNQLSAEGQLWLRDANLGVTSDQWHVGPIDLALPFRIQWPAASNKPKTQRVPNGTLTLDSLRFGSESVPAFKTALSLKENELRLNEPVRLPIYGGTIEIHDLAWNDIVKDPQGFSLSIEAKRLQLQKLTESLGWYRFGGTLNAAIPKVEMTGNVLRTAGQIQIEVFGGNVQVSKMEIENPFSALPAIKLEARFHGIHLEQASETFAFGRISGIVEGTISDLIITDEQPSQMRAEIQTVARSDSSQWISVEALNKITLLSSGEDGSLIYGGIASFFDEFRYSKMGFKATLRNDKLTLRGIESKDGKEYLVVGTLLPPTVDVISHTRDIDFSELVKRLEQVRKTDKPEIK